VRFIPVFPLGSLRSDSSDPAAFEKRLGDKYSDIWTDADRYRTAAGWSVRVQILAPEPPRELCSDITIAAVPHLT